MKRRRRKNWINPDDLHPDLAAGLTQSPSELMEKKEEWDSKPAPPSGIEIVRHMAQAEQVATARVPRPRFVAEPNAAEIVDEVGRRMQDVNITLSPEALGAMRSGYLCLRCLEPQPTSFPETCDLCGYAMRDRQIMDMAMEFEGEKHIGPSKPMSEYLAEQDLRREKMEFEKRLAEGRSRAS